MSLLMVNVFAQTLHSPMFPKLELHNAKHIIGGARLVFAYG